MLDRVALSFVTYQPVGMNTQGETKMPEKKERLIGAAVKLMLRQGFASTSVDEICAEAQVTKGSFFYYFSSKEEICLAAMDAWSCGWHSILDTSGIDQIPDPLDKIEALFQVMQAAYLAPEQDPGCMVGTIAQECSLPSERFREASHAHLEMWQTRTSKLLADAKAAYPPHTDFDPDDLSWWLCTFVQGTMLIAKTETDRTAIVKNNIKHCRAYVMGLFGRKEKAA